MLQCVAVCCSVLQSVAVKFEALGLPPGATVEYLLDRYVAICCDVLQCVAACCGV